MTHVHMEILGRQRRMLASGRSKAEHDEASFNALLRKPAQHPAEVRQKSCGGEKIGQPRQDRSLPLASVRRLLSGARRSRAVKC